MNYDVLQVIVWSATYVLIIVCNIRTGSTGIPPVSMINNFAWETMAIVYDFKVSPVSAVIHRSWFFLDLIILITYLKFCKPGDSKKKHLLIIYILELLILWVLFFHTNTGMLISSFVADIYMATEYFVYVYRNKLVTNLNLVFICYFKLIGDVFAWLFYKNLSQFAMVVGIAAMILNIGCAFMATKKFLKKS